MGYLFMFSIGALLGGLFLGMKDLAPYLAAKRNGVISRKGARAVRIRRDEDPDGFARLLANRSRGAALGFACAMAGALVLSLFGLAITGNSGPLALGIIAAYAAFGLFAAYCLLRGFLTGRMFAFWSMTLFGEAKLKENPTWFWLYAVLNLVTTLSAAAFCYGQVAAVVQAL